VPGDGRYEWAGFYDADQLPGAVNPDQGFLTTANECNLPEDFPPDRHITYDWYAPSRRDRLDEVLASTTDATPEGMVALQSDFLSTPARRIVNRLRALDVPEGTDGLALLRDWDGTLAADSTAAALFEVWYRARAARGTRPQSRTGAWPTPAAW
jgi:penicillin G amidase